MHPDLLEKQVLQGAEHSYRQASNILNAESKKERSINNDDRIRRNIAEVANIIENERRKPYKTVKQNEASKQLVAVIDGGCKKLINVLDWFHITKRFTIVLNRVDNDMKIRLEKVLSEI